MTLKSDIRRPKKDYGDLFPKAQTKKVSSLVSETTCDEVMVATSFSLYKFGMRSPLKIVADLNDVETIGQKIKRSLERIGKEHVKLPNRYSHEEALVLYIDLDLRKHTDKLMRCSAKERKADISGVFLGGFFQKGSVRPSLMSTDICRVLCVQFGLAIHDE